jgi:hypothetical protein
LLGLTEAASYAIRVGEADWAHASAHPAIAMAAPILPPGNAFS